MKIKKSFRVFIGISIIVASVQTLAGPFGLDKGMSLDALKKSGPFESTSQSNVYMSKSIRDGHPDVESYIAILTPNQGLCKITAITRDVQTSSYGTELRRKVENFKSALEAKYGAPSKQFDFLAHKSIWDDSRYWMMSLLKKDRHFSFFWSSPAATLPDELSTIGLEAVALNVEKGFVRLGYEFNNIDSCLEEDRIKINKNL